MSTTNIKWLPPQQEGFGPWIEFTGEPGVCPVDADTEVEYLTKGEQRIQVFWPGRARASAWPWRSYAAYCVKLEEQPAASGQSPHASANSARETESEFVMSTTNSKWLPPQQEGFGPWIEFEGPYGRCPAAPDTKVGYLLRSEREKQSYYHEGLPAGRYEWGDRVVAYCVKLEEQPAASGQSAPDTALTGGKLTGDHYYRVAVSDPMALDLQPYVAECADIIEALGMTFNEGEAFKALWRLAAARQGRGKPGNKPQYDADKAAHYGQRVAVCERRKAGAE